MNLGRLRSLLLRPARTRRAGESTFPEARGLAILREGGDEPSASFFYFRARRMIQQLICIEGLTFDEVVEHPHDEAAVLERLRARLKR